MDKNTHSEKNREFQPEYALEERIIKKLEKMGLSATTVESCTGGLLAGRLLNAPGASSVYKQGYITYSNEAKEKLAYVSHDTLKAYGAVSAQTAQEMAVGAAKAAGADAALATTGIAGPGGGTAQKPVGLVYIGCYLNGKTTVEEHVFAGERAVVRSQSVEAALRLLERMLSEESL